MLPRCPCCREGPSSVLQVGVWVVVGTAVIVVGEALADGYDMEEAYLQSSAALGTHMDMSEYVAVQQVVQAAPSKYLSFSPLHPFTRLCMPCLQHVLLSSWLHHRAVTATVFLGAWSWSRVYHVLMRHVHHTPCPCPDVLMCQVLMGHVLMGHVLYAFLYLMKSQRAEPIPTHPRLEAWPMRIETQSPCITTLV